MSFDTMHLFAGAGGGLLADLILGHNPIVAVEWDTQRCDELRERSKDGWYPDLSVWEGDIRMFNPSEYAGRVDCISAGFPCQDISTAGSRAGLGAGTRSGLYREVLRVAGIVRPRYLFLENVSAIRSKGLERVLADLAALGYNAQWTCLRASECGAPHQRDRWWLLAYSDSARELQSEGRKQDKWGRPDYQAERAVSGRTWFEIEPSVDSMVYGLPNGVSSDAVKALGNAQVPLQAATAWCLLGGPMGF